jgi:N-acyl-D-amino-acid deacylase
MLADKVSQGVTTEVVGNCGYSAFPVTDRNRPFLDELLRIISPGPWTGEFRSWQEYADAVERSGTQVNLVGQVGHALLRSAVLGLDIEPPSQRQLSDMQRLLATSLAEGAAGLSFGLMYHPGSFTQHDELKALCEVVADHGGFVSVHLRSYDHEGLLASIDEMISAAGRTGVRLQFSHLSPTGRVGQTLTEPMLTKIDDAADAGMTVAFDRYPYPDAFSRLSVLFPKWALAGGPDAVNARLDDPEQLKMIASSVEHFLLDVGFDGVIFVGAASGPLRNKSLADIAKETGRPAPYCAATALREMGSATPIRLKLSTMEAQERILQHPLCMVGSDGVPCCGGTHPRTFGTYSRILGPMVRDDKISLPQAIHKMTAQPADWLGLADRGRIQNGAIADLVLFDPDTIVDRSTFDDPYVFSAGIKSVFVAGHEVFRDGEVQDASPGRVLRPAKALP